MSETKIALSIYVDIQEYRRTQQRETVADAYERVKERMESVSSDSMLVSAACFAAQGRGRRVGWDSPGVGGISCRRTR